MQPALTRTLARTRAPHFRGFLLLSIYVNVHYVFARELYFYLTQSGASASGESIASIMTVREGRIS